MSNLLNIKDQNGNWIPIPIATNGIASIVQNSDYTLTIILEDGTVYTTTSIRGEKGDKGDRGIQGIQGDAFTYANFTPEQLASLKGAKGDKGDAGDDYILTQADKEEIASLVDIPLATTTIAGLMSAQDKTRLDDIYADYSSALTALGVI